MHDFASLHNRSIGSSAKRSRSRSLFLISGLLLVAVGVKHLAERGEGPAHTQAESVANADAAYVAPVPQEKIPQVTQEASHSLINKLIGENNRSGFEFYDMLKHAWPQASEMVAEVKAAQASGHAPFLQVASYREAPEAEKLRKKLIAMGLDASVETGGSDSGARWYRVFVGPFNSEAKLKKAEAALVKMSFAPLPSNR